MRPRVAEHHHEAHQRALRAPDPDLAEVGPIDLGLLAGKGLEPQIGLGFRLRPQGGDHTAEVALAPPVAAPAHHLVEPAGRQRRVFLQCLADEGDEGIELRGPRLVLPRLLGVPDRAPHGAVMDAELTRDRADLPLLGVIQPQDLRSRLLVCGHLTPLVPGGAPCAGPDERTPRRSGRRCCSGSPRRAPRPRRGVFRGASLASVARQHGGARASKGDASLSARSPHPEAPCSAAGPDSVSGAPRACGAPGARPGSAARRDAATLGARSRCTPWSSSDCRGRSGGREQPADDTAGS